LCAPAIFEKKRKNFFARPPPSWNVPPLQSPRNFSLVLNQIFFQ
jgi:hypothetical protein